MKVVPTPLNETDFQQSNVYQSPNDKREFKFKLSTDDEQTNHKQKPLSKHQPEAIELSITTFHYKSYSTVNNTKYTPHPFSRF